MIGFILGGAFVLMKLFGVYPVAGWSWWIVLAPLVLTVFWYEVIERMFDLRRRREERELQERHKERIAKLTGVTPVGKRK